MFVATRDHQQYTISDCLAILCSFHKIHISSPATTCATEDIWINLDSPSTHCQSLPRLDDPRYTFERNQVDTRLCPCAARASLPPPAPPLLIARQRRRGYRPPCLDLFPWEVKSPCQILT
ncbi:hypothetical protein VP01_288g2 [Puccinia sorghi]|uniref:Uncharacterized protein n=1 Tax=Puccinia sorghi TaxID=27349 RepID=A0A0L6V2C1_9BASI|nr:hypothetical protein VP01_288g2 [Puccinia sorghi]